MSPIGKLEVLVARMVCAVLRAAWAEVLKRRGEAPPSDDEDDLGQIETTPGGWAP